MSAELLTDRSFPMSSSADDDIQRIASEAKAASEMVEAVDLISSSYRSVIGIIDRFVCYGSDSYITPAMAFFDETFPDDYYFSSFGYIAFLTNLKRDKQKLSSGIPSIGQLNKWRRRAETVSYAWWERAYEMCYK